MTVEEWFSWFSKKEPEATDGLQAVDFAQWYRLADDICRPLRPYVLTALIYENLVYNLAAHMVIMDSETEEPPLSTLWGKYKVADYGGFISSASNDKTSAGYAVPKTFSEGDLSDWLYSATPYGRKYLSWVEQIKPLAVN